MNYKETENEIQRDRKLNTKTENDIQRQRMIYKDRETENDI